MEKKGVVLDLRKCSLIHCLYFEKAQIRGAIKWGLR